MNHLIISLCLTFLSSAINSIFILLHKPQTRLKQLWGLFSLAVGAWSFCFLQNITAADSTIALFWARALNLCAIFIPLFFFHFIVLFTDKISQKRLELKIYYSIISLYFLVILLFPASLISDVETKLGIRNYAEAGPLFILSPLLFSYLVIYALFLLIKDYKTSPPNTKNQIKYIAVGTSIGFLGGSTSYLLIFNINVYPYGIYLVPLYILSTSYAIVKHQLMDIRIVVRKSTVYTFLAASISLLYLLIVLALEKLFQTWFGYKSPKISIATAFFIGLLAVPLRQRIQAFVDRYFFKGTHQEIASQNEQLRREIAKSEKYKTISTLASGVAHEIKNPLTSVKTFCEYLPQKLDDKEFLLKFSRIVGREVERIDAMIHELLDYGKPAPLSLKETNIQRLITDTMDLLSNKFLAQHISVTQNLSPDNYHLKIDPARVKQALLNLFLNAIEAMPDGGRLTAASFVSRISSPETFVIKITDTGCGIPPEDLKRVFDPFFSGKDRGTGLGLAIVQGIMEQHQGKVRIESAVGVGTEVRLEFPLKRENTLNFA